MGELLSDNIKIANKILNEIQLEYTITDEKELLSDEFFVNVISLLAYEDTFKIGVGLTNDEKVENLDRIKEFLSNILEMDLSHINTQSIIYEGDIVSVGYLLDLINELIIVLKRSEEYEENVEENPKEEEGILNDIELIRKEDKYTSNNLSNYNSENKKENQLLYNYNSNKSDLSKNLNDNSLLNFDNTKLSEKGYTYIGDRSTSKNTQTIQQKSNTNSQIKNLQEMSFRYNSNDKSSSESDISVISMVSNVNTITKKNSHSFNDSAPECESLIPLSSFCLKNEILKEINNNINLNSDLCNLNSLGAKKQYELIETVVKKMKELRIKTDKRNCDVDHSNVVITKEFMLNHKREIEEIIKGSFTLMKKKNLIKTEIANKMIKNIKAIELIENKKFKLLENKIKKQKEDYYEAKKNSIKQIEFVNNLFMKYLNLEKQNYFQERHVTEEINNKILVDKIDRVNFEKKNFEIKIKSFKDFISKEKVLDQKYSNLKLDINI